MQHPHLCSTHACAAHLLPRHPRPCSTPAHIAPTPMQHTCARSTPAHIAPTPMQHTCSYSTHAHAAHTRAQHTWPQSKHAHAAHTCSRSTHVLMHSKQARTQQARARAHLLCGDAWSKRQLQALQGIHAGQVVGQAVVRHVRPATTTAAPMLLFVGVAAEPQRHSAAAPQCCSATVRRAACRQGPSAECRSAECRMPQCPSAECCQGGCSPTVPRSSTLVARCQGGHNAGCPRATAARMPRHAVRAATTLGAPVPQRRACRVTLSGRPRCRGAIVCRVRSGRLQRHLSLSRGGQAVGLATARQCNSAAVPLCAVCG